MRTRRKVYILAGLALAYLAIVQRSSACNLPPVAYVSNWQQFVGLDAEVTLDGTSSYDNDGYIVAYEWTFPSAAYNISGRYSAVAHCRFNTRGAYTIYLDVFDDLYAWDTDDAQVYVIEADLSWDGSTYLPVNCDDDNGNQVQDMLDSSAGAEDNDLRAIHLDITPDLYGGDAQLSYSGNATIKVWLPDATNRKYALITLPRTWAAARVPSTLYVEGIAPNSAPNGSQLTLSYIKNGATLHSDSVTFTVFDVQLDTSFPASVAAGRTLQLNCTPRGDTTGSFAWSKVSGPGTVTFAPGAGAEDPTFSTAVDGSYTVQVQYTKDGVSVTRTSGTITVDPVSVDITPPGGSVTERYHTLQLDCTPHGGTGSNYVWWKISGPGSVTFSNATIKNPTFLTNTAGNYSIGLQCRINDITVIAPVTTITVVDVDVTAPGSFPVSVARGSPLALDCIGLNGTATGYTWTPVELITPSNIQNPTFTANTAGIYTATVQCTVGGITVSDTTGSIYVIGVGQLYAACGPDYSDTALYVPKESTVILAAYPSPEYYYDWPANTPTWSLEGPGGTLLPNHGTYGPSAFLTNLTIPGTYTVTAHCGTSTKSITVTVLGIGISIPLASQTYVARPVNLTLDCAPDPGEIPGGTYLWTVDPTTGASITNATQKTANFLGSLSGTYNVQVAYTVGTVTVNSPYKTITVVSVAVDPPATDPLTIKAGDPVALSCTPLPSGADGNDYTWTVVAPATVTPATGQSTVFSSTEPGHYAASVQCQVEGVLVGDATNVISVIGVGQLYASCGPDYSDTVLYVSPGSMVTLGAYPSPEHNASWPVNAPTWSLQGPGGTLAPTYGTYGPSAYLGDLTEPGTYTVTAHCGTSSKSIQIVVVDVDMQLGTTIEKEGFLELGEVRQITLSVQPEDPNAQAGQGVLLATAGAEKVKVWLDQERTSEVNLPAIFPLPQRQTPVTLWVEAVGLSSTWNDVQLQWSFNSPGGIVVDEDTLSLTTIDVNVVMATPEVYVDGTQSSKVVQIGLETYSSLDSGVVMLRGISGYDPNFVRFWADEARTQEITLPGVWDLSDPNVVVPQVIYMELIDLPNGPPEITAELAYGRDEDSIVKTSQVTISSVYVDMIPMWEGDPAIEPNLAKPMLLGISLVPSQGYAMLEATNGGSYVRVWADEGRTTEVNLPARWFFPVDQLPERVYVEGSAGDFNEPVALKLSFHVNPEVSHVSVDLLSLAPGQTKECGYYVERVTCCRLVDWITHQNVVPFEFHPLESDGTCPTGIERYQLYPDRQLHPLIWLPYWSRVWVSRECSGISCAFDDGTKEAVICQGDVVPLNIMLSYFTPILDDYDLPYARFHFSYEGASWIPGSTDPGPLRLWYGGRQETRMSESDPKSSGTVGDFLDGGCIFIDWLGLGGVTSSTVVAQTVDVEGLTPGNYEIQIALSPYSDDPIERSGVKLNVTVLADCQCLDYTPCTPVEKNGVLYSIGEPIKDGRITGPKEGRVVAPGCALTVTAKEGYDNDCMIMENGSKDTVSDKIWITWSDNTGRVPSEAFTPYHGWSSEARQTQWITPSTPGTYVITCRWRNVATDCFYPDADVTYSRSVQVVDLCTMNTMPASGLVLNEYWLDNSNHKTFLDDCGNKVEVKLNDGNHCLEMFYNNMIVGRCIWDWGHNLFKVEYTNPDIHGKRRIVFTAHSSKNDSPTDGEGCPGYRCFICTKYNAITGVPVYNQWRGRELGSRPWDPANDTFGVMWKEEALREFEGHPIPGQEPCPGDPGHPLNGPHFHGLEFQIQQQP